MKKQLLSLILGICILLSLAAPVAATQPEREEKTPGRVISISTEAAFLRFAESCRLDSYSENLTVELKKDIRLTQADFAGVPIFCGTFRGNGHTISGLNMTTDGSFQGLFRYLTADATVENLHIEGTVSPEGSRSTVGGLAGQNAGRIKNCSFTGQLDAGDRVGGIVGVNTVSGIIEQCTVTGTITGNHMLGGIVGENKGVIRECKNKADINTTAQQNQISLDTITLDTITQTEDAVTITDMGGIAGTSTGVIRSCTNLADVGYQHMGYNIGGIVGSQSGTVVNCENRGSIRGRKEVGGIVGHLEPAALIEFDEDALQILKRQLGAMGNTINQTSANVQHTAIALSGPINDMGYAVQDAWEAASLLIPENDWEMPDEDTLDAARNGLSDSMWEMSSSLEGISYVAQNSLTALSANLSTLQQQVSAMSATLGNVSQTINASIEDVSDQDTEQDLTGKLAGCSNRGDIHADLNVGGIVGAMALESDLESASHLETVGERSLNFTSKVRSVILNCDNIGQIDGGKQNVGGIVGFQTLGLIRKCANGGPVGADAAQYVGGIVGRSNGYLRSNAAKCQLAGDAWLGGIAGSATIVTDCLSMVEIQSGREKTGAILGICEEASTDVEEPIQGNWYAIQNADLGGIDGISYAGKAQGQDHLKFMERQGLPNIFETVTIRFVFDDGTEQLRSVKPGGSLPANMIPELPSRSGMEAQWEGLEDTDLSHLHYDVTFYAKYTGELTVIATQELRGSQPLALIQGAFQEGAAVSIQQSESIPQLPEAYWFAGSWSLAVEGAKTVTGGRILLPEQQADTWHILVCGADGTWQEVSCEMDGSYLVFPVDSSQFTVALAGENAPVWYWYAAGGILAAAVLLLLLRKRKK